MRLAVRRRQGRPPVHRLKTIWSNLKVRVFGQPDILTVDTEDALGQAQGPVSQDALAAMAELSEAVGKNPDAVSVWLALGNLYRAQGEIQEAVQIRDILLKREDLSPTHRAKAWCELGRDYRRGGFVDRALEAFDKAYEFLGRDHSLLLELAELHAERGEYERAAEYYGRLDAPVPQAHYLTKLGHDAFASGDEKGGFRWLGKALKAYPASVEAWLLRCVLAIREGEPDQCARTFQEAFEAVSPSVRFLILEGLLEPTCGVAPTGKPADDDHAQDETRDYTLLHRTLGPILESSRPDCLNFYYGAELLARRHEPEQARAWLEKALVLRSDFWPARLQLLALSMEKQQLSPVFKVQLEFFIAHARQIERFFCRACGLKRGRMFFVCPRCHTWHSIAFRSNVHD